jgi:diaminopimelate epimerase
MKKPIPIPFTKMSGTGNDFIVIDNRSKLFVGNETDLFSQLCQRRVSVGADGIILLKEGIRAPVRMHYYNADGKEAPMCGNGARCAGFFAYEKRWVHQNHFLLEADDGIHDVTVSSHDVRLSLPAPTDCQTDVGILRETGWREGGFMNTGVPHYVLFVEDVDSVLVEETGRYYRNHQKFASGTNVDFVQYVSDGRLKVRTYERGVERETLSCGTGSVASALFASREFELSSPVEIITLGGHLAVHFNSDWSEISLSGRVSIIYEGLIPIASI